MSKAKDKSVSEPADSKQPEYISELLLNGTTVLKAKTREELAEMVNDIPADCRYAVGAVGRSAEDGTYSLRVDIVNN